MEYVIAFFLGASLGSFLNVLIYRFDTGMTIGGRSMCMSCSKTLTWYELIPVLSWIMLRGKCKDCKSKISPQYVLVELTTGLIAIFFAFVALQFLFPYSLLFWIVLFISTCIATAMVGIVIYDSRHLIIPDTFTVTIAVGGLLLYALTDGSNWTMHLLAGPAIGSVYFFLWAITRGKGMGFGDVKLGVAIGWLLGLNQGLVAMILSFWIGAIVGIVLLLFKKKGFTSQIPFGPYMVIAAGIVYAFSLTFIDLLNLINVG